MKNVINWLEDKKVNNLSWVSGRNSFAVHFSKTSTDNIVQNHIYMPMKDMENILNRVLKYTDTNKYIRGTGLELGAGIAALSALFSRNKYVKEIYAVELVPKITKLLQPKVIEKYGDPNKVIPVVGSFDDIKLPDHSVDFIIEYDSLHHSFNLSSTIEESYRVLRRNGILLALDRAHYQGSDPRVMGNAMNVVYSKEFLKKNGYPEDMHLTRKDNGEHEIYENEYIRDFYAAGFTNVKRYRFLKVTLRQLAYSVITMIPFRFRKNTRFKNISCYPFYILVWPWLFFLLGFKRLGNFVKLPKSSNEAGFKTVFVAYK